MGTGRKKIEIKKIEKVANRRVTFCKRRRGLFKKAEELSRITGCQVAVLAFSSSDAAMKPYLFGDFSLMEAAAAASGGAFGDAGGLKVGSLLMSGGDEAVGAESAVCSMIPSSTESVMINYNDDASGLKMVPWGSLIDASAASGGDFGDMECLKIGSLPGGSLGTGSCYEAEEPEGAVSSESTDMINYDDGNGLKMAPCGSSAAALEFPYQDCDGPCAAKSAMNIATGTEQKESDELAYQSEMINYNDGSGLKMVPCGSSPALEFPYQDYESSCAGESAMSITTEGKESDEGLLLGTIEDGDLDLRKQRMEAFADAVIDEYIMDCEAEDMISQLLSEDDLFILHDLGF